MIDYSHQDRISPEHLCILQKFTAEIPVQVGALAKELGLKVVVAPLPLNISGLIQPDGPEDFVVKVNRFDSKKRQRFTIAHEIAHFLLHRDRINNGVVDSVLYRSKLSSRAEAEANRLAADIVMPKAAINKLTTYITHGTKDEIVERLADKFQVSRQAMEIRIGD